MLDLSHDRLNWAGSHRIAAQRILAAESLEEAQEFVAAAPRVRAIGTRHSFNDIVDDAGDVLTLTHLPAEFQLDEARREVTVNSGVRYGGAAAELQRRGFALHNMGSLPHISIAGAIATGTHGSGNRNGGLATAVRGIDLIGADGTMQRLSAQDADFDGVPISLGALGVIARVTLAIEPTYQVRQDVFVDLPWAAGINHFEEITAAAYSVSMFTQWDDRFHRVWLKTRIPSAAHNADVPEQLWEAQRLSGPDPLDTDDNLTVKGGVPGPWSERLPHFRLDAQPSSAGDEIQTEYFIDRADAPAALSALRQLAPAIRSSLIVTELRTVAKDTLWMSPAYGRDSLGIHFTWRNDLPALRRLLPDIERVLEPFAPRPHWGKNFSATFSQPGRRQPQFEAFQRLVDTLDPTGKFRNEFLARVGLTYA